jgi:CRP-like cAMP-binding protein
MKQDWMFFLTRIGTTKIFRLGENIFMQGDPARYLYYLEEGMALTYYGSEDGRERGVMAVWPGEFFGLASFLQTGEHQTTVVAVKECRVLVVDVAAYRSCAEKYPQFLPDMMGELSQEVRVLFEQLADTSLLDSDRKVARFLCRRVERGQYRKEGGALLLEFSQEVISRVLGLSRWTVNQVLNQFKGRGWVSTGYRAVAITDYDALRRFAGA